jgi:hypothetical protein
MSHATHARVIRWIDGDTVVADCYVWPGVTITEHIRLTNVDTAEAGERGYQEAKDRVNELAPVDSVIEIVLVGSWNSKNAHKRTFARLPGHVFHDHSGVTISEILTQEHLTKADFAPGGYWDVVSGNK